MTIWVGGTDHRGAGEDKHDMCIKKYIYLICPTK